MDEVIITAIVAAVTGFLGWVFSKLQTRRERKKGDLQMISDAISPLVTSIGDLTKQNKEIVGDLLIEQDKVLQLMTEKAALIREKGELAEKVERLEKQVSCLNKRINDFIKNNKNEN